MLSHTTILEIRRNLLAFFAEHARPLPWRATDDAYAVLVSEVMSQQTRVATVIPYYERWLRHFPDVTALAAAEIDDVLKLWEGLGYYSRARNLHASARIIRERHNGSVPADYAELRALPGIGDYTAGAVASIAGGAAHVAVDGNVRRVIARLLDEATPSAALVRDVAAALIPHDQPGDFNQALMELGATICTPRTPRCTCCPIATHCAARVAGTQQQRPLPKPKKALPVFDVATAVLVDDERRTLLVRRTSTLLHGMWTFPGIVVEDAADAHDAVLRIAADWAVIDSAPTALGTVEHTFSHRRERYACWLVPVSHTGSGTPHEVWIGEDAGSHALSRAQQRIHTLARAALDVTTSRS
jgi:A/G-specific adenine glycosylase